MTVELGILIALGGFLLSAATFFIGRRSAARSDGKAEGVLLTEVRQIGGDVRDIKADITLIKAEQGDLRDRLTRLETRVEMYHNGGSNG